MNHARLASRRSFLAALVAFAACTGGGSDIGPSFSELPAGTCKATVRDNQGLGVSGAVVRVADGVGVTGRTGRAELYGDRRGARLVRVDASNATAKETDRLASIAFEAAIVGPDLPNVIYLPDTGPSATLTVGSGAALPATDLDDSANSGAILRLDAGTVVADGGNGSVQLRIGELARERLPSPLPAAPSGAWLCTRAFWVDPPTATFAPPATLVVPDEIALGSANCVLFRLDPVTGQWQQASGTAAGSGGSIQLSNGVTSGGLHIYAVETAPATIRGQVVNECDCEIPGALVRVDTAMTTTDALGRFEAVVAGVDAANAPRDVAVELVGGGSWLSVVATGSSGPLGANANVDLGQLTFETAQAGDVRMQFIRRGRAVSSFPVAVGGGFQPTLSGSYADLEGQCTLEEVPASWFGSTSTALLSDTELTTTDMLSFLGEGTRSLSVRYYFADRAIASNGRSTRLAAVDAISGALLQGAEMVRGRVAEDGYLGVTREAGVIVANRTTFDRLTTTLKSIYGPNETTSAFSFEGASGNRIEFPMEREQKRAPGAYDRHGVARGQLLGADPAKEQRVLASRPLGFGEWFATRMQGAVSQQAMPVRTGGLSPQFSYRAGVAQPEGNVVVAEGSVAGGRFTLTAAGALLGLVVPEGTAADRDLPIDRPVDQSFLADGALSGLDASFAAGDLRFDLAFQRASGAVVEVALEVAGNMAVSGDDISFLLPALEGPFADGSWLVALHVESSTATTAQGQQLLLRLRSSGSEVFPMLALPTITSPTDGLVVPASGFTVQFSAPTGASFAQIDLRSEGIETKSWTAVVPASTSEFAFVALPDEADSPLVAGRIWTLKVSTWRADVGYFATPGRYGDLPTFWRSLGAGNQGMRAGSSRTITIATN